MIDLWDVSALVCAGLVVGGVSLWSVPAALVLTGCSGLALYYLRERSRVPQSPPRPDE